MFTVLLDLRRSFWFAYIRHESFLPCPEPLLSNSHRFLREFAPAQSRQLVLFPTYQGWWVQGGTATGCVTEVRSSAGIPGPSRIQGLSSMSAQGRSHPITVLGLSGSLASKPSTYSWYFDLVWFLTLIAIFAKTWWSKIILSLVAFPTAFISKILPHPIPG